MENSTHGWVNRLENDATSKKRKGSAPLFSAMLESDYSFKILVTYNLNTEVTL